MKPRTEAARHPARSHGRAHIGGWSLIEMLVVVAVLAALTLAAVPAYRSAMLRAHRVEATAGLAGLAAAQERFRLQHNTYADDLQALPPDGLGLSATSAGGRYALAITRADAFDFTATATARGRQSQDTHCAEFGIDATGARTATHDDCWSR